MENDKFKIRDVDAWKEAFLKINSMKGKYPELDGLNLKNPGDVFKLHSFVKEKGIKEKSLDYILGSAKNKEVLPNIIFDVTLKDESDITEVVPSLLAAGYKLEDIHLTWVLAHYHQAVNANKSRARVVPDDILLKTHEGAAKTMWSIIKRKKAPADIDGEIRIVLNNRENTKVSNTKNSRGERIVTSFDYVLVKKSKGSFIDSAEVEEKIKDWISSNIPKTKETSKIFIDT